jgi:zinc protease
MITILRLIIICVLVATAGCRRAPAADGDLLPGRSRPLLNHGWAHPRDLEFGANAFQPPDGQAALVTTPAGLRAYVLASDGDPVVQISAVLPLGTASEQSGEEGASDVIVRLLQQDVAARLGSDFVGRLQVDQDVDVARITVQTLADGWRPGLAAIVGALRNVKPDPAVVAGYRTGLGYTRPTRNLGGAGFRPAVELAWLTAGRPIAPPDANLQVRPQAVADLMSRSLGPASIVLAVGGGAPRGDVVTALSEASAGWTSHVPAVTPLAPGGAAPRRERFLAIDEPGATTWLAVGHPMTAVAVNDDAAVAVMTQIVNIRLNIAIREIRGLANQAVLQVPATVRRPGLLHVRSGARPESIGPIVRYVKEELSRIREQAGRPTEDELEQAKGGLVLSQWQRSLDGARVASATFAVETAQNGSLDRLLLWPEAVRAVTAEQVQAAASKYIQPDQLATVIIGQLDAVRTARHPRWPAAIDELTNTAARVER